VRCAHTAACAVQCSARACLSLGICWAQAVSQGRQWACVTRGPGSRALEHGTARRGAESCAIRVSANAEKYTFESHSTLFQRIWLYSVHIHTPPSGMHPIAPIGRFPCRGRTLAAPTPRDSGSSGSLRLVMHSDMFEGRRRVETVYPAPGSRRVRERVTQSPDDQFYYQSTRSS
jgi:hypothetical protein